ncbi:hypothetical protein K443DRAFT_130509 [Laccaria amethystina LaAM-08-1]|uniref:Uncharacterized protein n=1 Tax=Laccaria amethystina LaAM-08-1 TaxID=1095629 RepID=A0A0C9Y4Y8_9AGAR|nr:hypothetical protein K443DRAFT_130509 [Laccaria amethystina LaAM-08-1]
MATTVHLPLTQPPSPTTPHHRPPSRSERLLRDTLKRDEQERIPTHRRRHSVNTSPHPAQGAGEDNYARGTYLFRTAMNAPRVPSPSPSRHTFNHTPSPYHGSPELEGQTRYHYHQRGAQRSPPRSPSPSPSGRRNHSLHPSPLLPSHGLSRQGSLSQPGRPRGASQAKHRPPAVLVPRPGEPMGMTPHEQVLRARLERVLSAGRIVSDSQAAQTTTKRNSREEMRERERRRRSNEVRDEVDGWPWREREYDSPSLVSTPPHSSSSGSSSSNIPNQTQQHIQFQTHVRHRSKTDPNPPPTSSTTASPRRHATAPNTAATPPRAPHQQQGAQPRSKYSQSRERERQRDEDARLLTPPPTPPFSFQEYHPSPYPNKTRLTPRRPTHAPVHGHGPGGGEGDDTCSTSSSSSLHSLPPSPYAYDSPPLGQQGAGGSPQFNARKASARCRAIEGYGLGEPAEVEQVDDEEEEGRGRMRGRSVGGGGVLVGALRRLLGGGGERGVVV